ncbi:hypothetical protein [Lederbergia lenta]|uniref:Uncharacterized protein n=1 Tax=Lederbergia lenta TaxID=1467 RepID=A0A2X4VTW4_LEDLE|nr:hypothetical protein [Lederbergia lenta]MEC2325604.1 hypothetical protein [Lederbergia lenta]SQI54181.1 Uncharacterised protein [Lederbergia lenta]
MTVVLLICVVPPTNSPFVMIAADSRATGQGGGVVSKRDKDIILDAGNAFMSTSGSVYEDYREDLARYLRERTKGTIIEKMEVLQVILGEDKEDFKLQLDVGLVQFDSAGNPQMGLCTVDFEGKDTLVGPYTYDKSKPVIANIYSGATRTEEVERLRGEFNDRLNAEEINIAKVESAAKWFIGKVAKIPSETVDNIVQTKTMRFK